MCVANLIINQVLYTFSHLILLHNIYIYSLHLIHLIFFNFPIPNICHILSPCRDGESEFIGGKTKPIIRLMARQHRTYAQFLNVVSTDKYTDTASDRITHEY